MPTPASVSDRIRAKQLSHQSWADDMERQLDEIDDMEAQAKPVLEGAVSDQRRTVESMHNDALAMAKAAGAIRKNDPSPRSAGESGTMTKAPLAVVADKPAVEAETQKPTRQTTAGAAYDGTEFSQVKWTGQRARTASRR